jgi:zinc transport system substrate-binding protein
MKHTCYALVLALLAQFATVSAQAEPPRIMTSLPPMHSLVSMVTNGIIEPQLLIHGKADEHHFAFKPSDMEKMQKAQLIFYFSDDLETYLKPLKEKYPEKQFIPVALQEKSQHPWLSPAFNKKALSRIADILAKGDPMNAETYYANASHYQNKLTALSQKIQKKMPKEISGRMAVSHDAYDAFEVEFGLPRSIVLSQHESYGLKPHAVRDITSDKNLPVRCVLMAGHNDKKFIQFAESLNAKAISLHPLGVTFSPGKELISSLLTIVSQKYQECLTAY